MRRPRLIDDFACMHIRSERNLFRRTGRHRAATVNSFTLDHSVIALRFLLARCLLWPLHLLSSIGGFVPSTNKVILWHLWSLQLCTLTFRHAPLFSQSISLTNFSLHNRRGFPGRPRRSKFTSGVTNFQRHPLTSACRLACGAGPSTMKLQALLVVAALFGGAAFASVSADVVDVDALVSRLHALASHENHCTKQ